VRLAAGRVHAFFIHIPAGVQALSLASMDTSMGRPRAMRGSVSPRGFLMRRLSTEYPFTCVTCEVEITRTAVFHVGLPFCCSGCVAGGPCTCSYDEEVTEHERAGDLTAFSPAALADDPRGLAHARR
jgi:hypothetical protein